MKSLNNFINQVQLSLFSDSTTTKTIENIPKFASIQPHSIELYHTYPGGDNHQRQEVVDIPRRIHVSVQRS